MHLLLQLMARFQHQEIQEPWEPQLVQAERAVAEGLLAIMRQVVVD
jgi:hypothetical protein